MQPEAQLKTYITESIFFKGFGLLPPIGYLTTESAKCLSAHRLDSGYIFDTCGGVIVPQLCITLSFVILIIANVAYVHLTTTVISPWQAASFEDLNGKVRIQCTLLSLVVSSNIVLFSAYGEGPATSLMSGLLIVCIVSTMSVSVIEAATIMSSMGKDVEEPVERELTQNLVNRIR